MLIITLSPMIADAIKTSVTILFTFLIALATIFCGIFIDAKNEVVTWVLLFATITIVGSVINADAVAGVSVIFELVLTVGSTARQVAVAGVSVTVTLTIGGFPTAQISATWVAPICDVDVK